MGKSIKRPICIVLCKRITSLLALEGEKVI